MVICNCRAVLESEVLKALEKNPDTPFNELMAGNGKKGCCKHCRTCADETKKIIAEHSANTKRS